MHAFRSLVGQLLLGANVIGDRQNEEPMLLNIVLNAASYWSYAYAGTRRNPIRAISVKFNGELPDNDILVYPRVTLSSPFDEPMAEEWCGEVRTIEVRGPQLGEPVEWTNVSLSLNYVLLGRIEEKAPAQINVEVVDDRSGEVLTTATQQLTILGRQDWLWDSSSRADALAAFVNTRSQAVRNILTSAREILRRETGDPSTEGYQSGPHRATKIARAVYEAIGSLGINYSNPPSGFDGQMQRIRTPDEVVADRAGTCLDTSVLMASCFAEAGLEPVIFLIRGHAFAGYFSGMPHPSDPAKPLAGDKFAEWIQDHTLSRSHRTDQLAELFAYTLVHTVETTTVCAGPSQRSFAEAMSSQNGFRPGDVSAVEAMVIVSNAWRAGITPPIRLAAASLHESVRDEESEFEKRLGHRREVAGAPGIAPEAGVATDVDDDESDYPPRVRQWMASLLDLSARNPLLRIKKNILDIEAPPAMLGKLDDRLFEKNGRITIVSPGEVPSTWLDNGVSREEFDDWSLTSLNLVYPSYRAVNSFASQVAQEAKKIKFDYASKGLDITDLQAALDAREKAQAGLSAQLDKSLKAVKQKAKENLLDTGTNCLFLGLGAVTWTSESDGRGKSAPTSWEAPLYLYPVIVDGGRKTPYTLRLDATGEATPNHCLREKLRRDPYNIELPELINPATDESGLDFDRMFESIRARLAEAKMHNFAVVPRVYLGVFDYSTFRLWADLHDSWEEMANISAAAKHLILTPNQQFPIPDAAEAPEPYLPIDADDSQEQAIRWALEGKSFRLEGPPGTGKTQTITNLLASCLAHGKKILFVAEKQTALDQVKKRMAAIGLSDYCLDLHAQGDSDARIRKNIETALTAALAAQADAREAEWKDVEFRIEREIRVLDQYRDALHDLGPAELSAWGANERLLAMPDLEPVPLPPGFLAEFSTQWPEVRRVIYEIRDLSAQAGTTDTNLWSFVDPGAELEPDSDEVRRRLQTVGVATNDLAKLQDIPTAIRTISDPISFAVISHVRELNATWGQVNQVILSGVAATSAWFDTASQAAMTADALLDRIGDNPLGAQTLLSTELSEIATLRSEVSNANFMSRRRKMRSLREAVSVPDTATDDEVLAAIDQLMSERDVAQQLMSTLGVDLGLPETVIGAVFGRAGNLGDLIADLRRLSEIIATNDAHRDSLAAFSQAAFSMSPMTSQLIITVANAWAELLSILPVSAERFSRRFGTGGLIETTSDAVAALDSSSSASGRFLDLDRWCRLMAAAARLEAFGFTGHRESIADGAIDFEQLAERIQLSVIKAALAERLQSGNLDRFDRKTHDSRIRALERALDESREILFDRIAGLIKARSGRRILPSGRPGGETQDLIRGLRPKRGEKVPIRDLITKFGESLADAMPCFMMSPDSVASLVPVGAINFDLVIFDEASQVRTSHAIGALGRGRAGIVVGDSKQMPPSSTFSSNLGAYVEDDETTEEQPVEITEDDLPLASPIGEAARDAESILTEFEESGFPALQLMCHYRSRDELLIAFSNTHVYDEPMLTFPSTAGLTSDALSLRLVPDGHFERSKNPAPWVGTNPKESASTLRTNVNEARAVVDEILARLRDPERKRRRDEHPGTSAESIIVVTFNRPQMDLVDAMLRDADPDLYATATAEWTDEDTGIKHDPQLKVRNLENVQGDEAETVIFSVAFSAREDGVFPLNFGPITQQGGIRRLNVAVTRAQREMIVYSSFRPGDMGDLSNKSEGAQMLQRFLQLAESGVQKTASVGVSVARSAHLREIATALEGLGFVTAVQLGLSQMRVDIAVRRQESPTWELAILADDPNWASRGSSFQREILPTRILTGLGWRAVARIWLPAWIEERDAVLSDLQRRLETLDSEDDSDAEAHEVDLPDLPPLPEPDRDQIMPPPPVEPVPIDIVDTGATPFSPFQAKVIGDPTILDRSSTRKEDREIVETLIAAVAKREGPVESRRLAKLVANCLGLSRVPDKRVNQVLLAVDPTTVFSDAIGSFVYPSGSRPETLEGFRPSQNAITRQPDEVSVAEYTNAIVWLLSQERSLSVEVTMREVGALFGFRRMTKNVNEVLTRALDEAVAAGAIILDDGRLRLAI